MHHARHGQSSSTSTTAAVAGHAFGGVRGPIYHVGGWLGRWTVLVHVLDRSLYRTMLAGRANMGPVALNLRNFGDRGGAVPVRLCSVGGLLP